MNQVISSHIKNHLSHLKSVRESIKKEIQKREEVEITPEINLYDKYDNNYKHVKPKILEGDMKVVRILKHLYNVKGIFKD